MSRQYTENATMQAVTTILGMPSQMRVFDSLSYLRMTSSTSMASADLPLAPAVAAAAVAAASFSAALALPFPRNRTMCILLEPPTANAEGKRSEHVLGFVNVFWMRTQCTAAWRANGIAVQHVP